MAAANSPIELSYWDTRESGTYEWVASKVFEGSKKVMPPGA